MTRRELDTIVSSLIKQGARARATKGGWLIYLPGGGTTSVHYTPSDPRATRNFRAHIERAGLKWPGKGKKP